MPPIAAPGDVTVTLKVAGWLAAQPQELAWQFQVAPRLEPALSTLVAELERRVSSELLHGGLVLLNGRNIQALAPDTQLHDGDVFMIVPPVAGGC
jgi:molybdopterin converting factor small subunit